LLLPNQSEHDDLHALQEKRSFHVKNFDFYDARLPESVRIASSAVFQLKVKDTDAFAAVNISKNWALTAAHVVQMESLTRSCLAVFGLTKGSKATARDVYSLELGELGWYANDRTGTHNVKLINEASMLEYAAFRVAQNIDNKIASDLFGVTKIAPLPEGNQDAQTLFMVSHFKDARFKNWSAGHLNQYGAFGFTHSIEDAGPGDSGAPIFDRDGNLIGIHVANVSELDEYGREELNAYKIACRADMILAALKSRKWVDGGN